jgi:hypothetical protein
MDLFTDIRDESIIAEDIEEFKEMYPEDYKKKSPMIPPEDDLDSDGLSDTEDSIMLPNLDPIQIQDLPKIESEKFEIPIPVQAKNKRKGKIAPVVPNETLPNLEGFAFLPYKNLLKQELNENEEMYETRSKIAELLSELKFEASGYEYSKLDSLAILNYSRMINDYLWLGVKYSKSHQTILEKLMDLIGI